MPSLIDIRRFKGVFSNADQEDIKPEYLAALNNMRSVNGELVKTHGAGRKGPPAVSLQVPAYRLRNLLTYFEPRLLGGFAYLNVQVSSESNLVYVEHQWGGVPTVVEDYANMKKFRLPYETPSGVTFTLDSTHLPTETGAQTITYSLSGYSALTGYSSYRVQAYVVTDIPYQKGGEAVSADVSGDTLSVNWGAGVGVKILRLEGVGTAYAAVTLATYSIVIAGDHAAEFAQGKLIDLADGDDGSVSGHYRVGWAGASYDSGTGNTTIPVQDAIADTDITDVTVFLVQPLSEQYDGGRWMPRSYHVPRTNTYFPLLGQRTYSYDHAQFIIALCAQEEAVANVDLAVERLLECQMPVDGGGGYNATGRPLGPGGPNDHHFLFSYFTHGYNAIDRVDPANPDELVFNGPFNADAGWTKGTGWTIASGQADAAAGSGSDLSQTLNGGALGANDYLLEFEVTGMAAGALTPKLTATAGTAITANGVYRQKITAAGGETTLVFTKDASFDGSILYATLKRAVADEGILGPDPYVRDGASFWALKALGFYLEKYPAGAHVVQAKDALARGLDKLVQDFLVFDSDSWQHKGFRGGRGWYDIYDINYTWHPTTEVRWLSTEHNIDAYWAFKYAETESLSPTLDFSSDIQAGLLYKVVGYTNVTYNSVVYTTGQTFTGVAGQAAITAYTGNTPTNKVTLGWTYAQLKNFVGLRLVKDVSLGGHWIEAEGRCVQGITATDIIDADATANTFRINGDGEALFKKDFAFQVNGSTGNDQSGTAYACSKDAVLDTTLISAGAPVASNHYYRVVGATPVVHNGYTYTEGDVFYFTVWPHSGGTIALNETVVYVASVADGTNDGIITYPDYAAALDTASWYAAFAKDFGYPGIAARALDYVRHFKTTSTVYPTIKGYFPYRSNVPGYAASNPWNLSYADSGQNIVWIEGTAGVIIARAALDDHYGYQSDILDMIPARDILTVPEAGYPYVDIVNAVFEMQAWSSLGATAPVVIAHNPNGFWNITIPTIQGLNATPFYHADARNPVIESDGILRLLPGRASAFTKSFPITGVSIGADQLTVEGDRRDFFPVGQSLVVSGSTGNNGTWTVTAVNLDANGDTVISVSEDITDATVDGTIAVTNQARPMWIGYIDRDFFDEQYSPAAAFKVDQAQIVAPDLAALGLAAYTWPTENGDAYASGDVRFYRFSYLYDGVQESLFSDPYRVEFDGDQLVELTFSLTTTSWNRRITGLKVYRSTAATVDGTYDLIQTIDFLREAADVVSGSSGAYTGQQIAFVPSLADYDFTGIVDPELQLDASAFGNITDKDGGALAGTGHVLFDTGTNWDAVDHWGIKWSMRDNPTVKRHVNDSGNTTEGAFVGNSVYIPTALAPGFYAGGIVRIKEVNMTGSITAAASASSNQLTDFTSALHGLADASWVVISGADNSEYNGRWQIESIPDANTIRLPVGYVANETAATWAFEPEPNLIVDNVANAVRVSQPVATGIRAQFSNVGYEVLSPSKGLYTADLSGSTITYRIYDTNLTSLGFHALEGEVSIDVHGRFARVINGRLFQADIVLDPAGKKEEHRDWVAWSELNQLDVNPVSNVKDVTDREGGECTGLEELFNMVVIAKRMALVTIDPQAAPNTPVSWPVVESAHNIGNLAPEGMIHAAGRVFVCHSDGIYALRANNLADTDSTPTERLRVSEPIGDVYQALSPYQIEAIKAGWDQQTSEVVFTLGDDNWAFNVDDDTWRQITPGQRLTVPGLDENARLIFYSEDDDRIYGTAAVESVVSVVKTKTFVVSDERKDVIRRGFVTYTSPVALTLSLYLDNATTATRSITLAAKTTKTTVKFGLKTRAQRIVLEITSPSGTDQVRIAALKAE